MRYKMDRVVAHMRWVRKSMAIPCFDVNTKDGVGVGVLCTPA